MKTIRIISFLLVFMLLILMGGCLSRFTSLDKDIGREYVEEYGEELLVLYDMYHDLEEAGEEDYTEIKKYKENILIKEEHPNLYFIYYHQKKKMEIWFDKNHDGYDWAVLYTEDPEFDITNKSHLESYEEIGNGFYIYTFRHGF